MCLFKFNRLQKQIELLEYKVATLTGERDKALESADSLKQEVVAKRNIIRQQDERIEKLKKRVETQQAIIEKQNAKLGVKKTAAKKAAERNEDIRKEFNYDKESDPYVFE